MLHTVVSNESVCLPRRHYHIKTYTNVFQNSTFDCYINTKSISEGRRSVPIKEYSNKFLRECARRNNLYEPAQSNANKRLNEIMKKQKKMNKQFQKLVSKHFYACKTESRESDYECFKINTDSLEQSDHSRSLRVNTESIAKATLNQTKLSLLLSADEHYTLRKAIKIDHPYGTPHNRKHTISTNKSLHSVGRYSCKQYYLYYQPYQYYFCSNSPHFIHFSYPKQEPKSTTRLKTDFYHRPKMLTHKRITNKRYHETNENLEAHQIKLQEKQSKTQWLHRTYYPQKKKPRQNNENVLYCRDIFSDNFEIKGWDIAP